MTVLPKPPFVLLFAHALFSPWTAGVSQATAVSQHGSNNPKHLHKKVSYDVQCTENQMTIEIDRSSDFSSVHLEHLKHYPEKKCQPEVQDDRYVFRLNLDNIFECMVTKVVDKQQGSKVYYHRVILELPGKNKQALTVRCDGTTKTSSTNSSTSSIVKRSPQVFPPFFQEPDYDIEITSEITGRAPVPELIVGVRQEGVLIDDELTVKPGTPLNMEISLDTESADIYGVMVSKMEVTDTRAQSEILVLNGCTVDPFLFENFYTEDGDLLRAKFKAFKFPESNFVLFKGVVNVCLDRCNSVECANGQLGFGKRRRRRDVESEGEDVTQQRLYEVSMSTVIRFEEEEKMTRSGAETPRAVTKREHAPAARQRHQLLVEKAILKNVFHPSNAEFGSGSAGQRQQETSFVEFEIDEEDFERNGAANHQKITATLLPISLLTVLLAFKLA